jgi:hypothetical protein
MSRRHLLPGQAQGMLHDDLGDLGEMIADDHQRHGAADIRSGHAQYP